MKEDQKRIIVVMIGIAALLQIISQYIRYSECSRMGGGGGTCSVGSILLQSSNFGYAYTTSGLLIIILLIFAFVFSLQSSNKVFGLITTAFTLKILQIIFALLSFGINGGNLRDAFKFIVGYTLNFYGDFALGTRLNPILLLSSIAIPILLIITMVRAQIPRSNGIESQQIWEQPISPDAAPQMNAPRVAAGWYPNPLANNAVMYWDGSQWLNIPAPTQISTSTESSGLAIAAFVTAFFVPILPIIFGHISLSQINRSNGRIGGKGLAIAGLVLGYVALVGWIFLFIGMVMANNYMYSDY